MMPILFPVNDDDKDSDNEEDDHNHRSNRSIRSISSHNNSFSSHNNSSGAIVVGDLEQTEDDNILREEEGEDGFPNRTTTTGTGAFNPYRNNLFPSLPPNLRKLIAGVVFWLCFVILVLTFHDDSSSSIDAAALLQGSSAQEGSVAATNLLLSNNNNNPQLLRFPYSASVTHTQINKGPGRLPITGYQSQQEEKPTIYTVSNRRARLQISNYHSGTALMLTIQLPHHGGSRLCDELGHGIGFAAEQPSDNRAAGTSVVTTKIVGSGYDCGSGPGVGGALAAVASDPLDYPVTKPWTAADTPKNTAAVRTYLHYYVWAFPEPKTNDPTWQTSLPISDTGWDHHLLVSILVVRHPLSRLVPIVTGTATVPASADTNDPRLDNAGLQILLGPTVCCQGEQTNPALLDQAKELLNRFTFVLDIECLQEGIEAIADLLNITVGSSMTEAGAIPDHLGATDRPEVTPFRTTQQTQPYRQYYPSQELYDSLARKNKLEIELYEWARSSVTLLQCGIWNNIQ